MNVTWSEYRSETNSGEKQARVTATVRGASDDDGVAVVFDVDWVSVTDEPIIVIAEGVISDRATPACRYLWLAQAIQTVMSEATGRLETLRAWLKP